MHAIHFSWPDCLCGWFHVFVTISKIVALLRGHKKINVLWATQNAPITTKYVKILLLYKSFVLLADGAQFNGFTHRSKHFADDLFQNDYSNGKSTPIKSAWNPRQTILKQFVLFGFGTPFLAVSFVEVQINVKIDECCFSSLHRFCFTNLSDFKSRISMQKKASSFRASHIHKISEFIIFNMIFIILKIFVSTVPTICWLQLNVLFFYSFNCRQSKKKKKTKQQ